MLVLTQQRKVRNHYIEQAFGSQAVAMGRTDGELPRSVDIEEGLQHEKPDLWSQFHHSSTMSISKPVDSWLILVTLTRRMPTLPTFRTSVILLEQTREWPQQAMPVPGRSIFPAFRNAAAGLLDRFELKRRTAQKVWLRNPMETAWCIPKLPKPPARTQRN